MLRILAGAVGTNTTIGEVGIAENLHEPAEDR